MTGDAVSTGSGRAWRRGHLERGLWVGVLAFGVVGAFRLRAADAGSTVTSRATVEQAPDLRLRGDSARDDSVAAAVEVLDHRNPFRREDDGAPHGATPFGLTGGAAPPRPFTAPTRPTLTLRGIVGVAPELRAVVDGIPGVDGSTLMAPGDTLRGFRLRRVTADSAVVQSADTTWHLGLRRAWP